MDNVIIKRIPYFDLSQICQSGQCFRMNPLNENKYALIAGSYYMEASQQGEECIFYCDEIQYETFWKKYFDLERDYSAYIAQIEESDSYLKAAAEFGKGIRILQQDIWEMIVTFLISQQNNMVRIRRCVENICSRYGEKKVNLHGDIYHAFPLPEMFADLDEDALKACNLGYRSKYVVRTAKSIAAGQVDLSAVSAMPYEQARTELLKLFGVGEKAADCICLFGLHHLQAFPVDTHIRQAINEHYRQGFPYHQYDGFQGVMQQYIFYYELFGKSIEKNRI